MRRYDTLPVQLEIPFEPPSASCPACSPSDDSAADMLRSMCSRHWREHCAAFDADTFTKEVEEALERGRKDAEAMRQYARGCRIPDGTFRTSS